MTTQKKTVKKKTKAKDSGGKNTKKATSSKKRNTTTTTTTTTTTSSSFLPKGKRKAVQKEIPSKNTFDPNIDQSLIKNNSFSLDYGCFDQTIFFTGVFRFNDLSQSQSFTSILTNVYDALNGDFDTGF